MGSVYEDTVFDFDLNLLNQSTIGTTAQNKYEKQRKSIAVLKKKIIATDSLITKYYAKKECLEDSEKFIVSLKEQCKQVRIDYKNALEKITQWENDYHILQNAYKTLEETCFNVRNQFEAQQSHSNQLQILLKEKDTTIESLKVEKKLDKVGNKDIERKLTSLSKEKETLLKDISIFTGFIKKTLGKRKLKPKYSALLRKYDTSISDGNNSDWGDSSDVEEGVFEGALLSPPSSKINNMVKKCVVAAATPVEFDNDYSNEVVSVDTGRGSSLACSDNEKGLHSPDYSSNGSPSNEEVYENKATTKVVRISISPIMFKDRVEMATSPIIFRDRVEIATSPIMFKERNDNATRSLHLTERYESSTTSNKLKEKVEIATIPITFKERDNIETRSIQFTERDEIVISNELKERVEVENSPKLITESDNIATIPIQFTERDEISTSNQLKERVDIETDTIMLKERDDIATIPIQFTQTDEIAISPVSLERVDISNSPITVQIDSSDIYVSENVSSISEKNSKPLNTIHKTFPIEINDSTPVSTYPLNSVTREIVTHVDDELIFDEISANKHTPNAREQECLEINNSNNLRCNKECDYEIGLILNTMQLNYKAVSPIPKTPSITRGVQTSNLSIQTENTNNVQQNPEEINKHFDCTKYIRQCMIALGQLTSFCKPLGFTPSNFLNEMTGLVDSSNNECSKGIVTETKNVPLEETIENSDLDSLLSQSDPVYLPVDNLALISNRSSTESHTVTDSEILQKNLGEIRNCRISLPRLQNQHLNKLSNQKYCLSEQMTKIKETSLDIDNDICPNKSVEINQTHTKDSNVKKAIRKKLTKLDKFKKKLKPKYKIRREISPLMKSRSKPKQCALTENKVTDSNTSASLNDKTAYAKAVKVMEEFNSKQRCKSSKSVPQSEILSKISTQQEECIDSCVNHKQTSPTSNSHSSPKLKESCSNGTTQLEEDMGSIADRNQILPPSELNSKQGCKLPNSPPKKESLFSKVSPQSKGYIDTSSPSELISKKGCELSNSASMLSLNSKIKTQLDKHVDSSANCKQTTPKTKLNSKQDNEPFKSAPETVEGEWSQNRTTQSEEHINSTDSKRTSPECLITTRSKRKYAEQLDQCAVILTKVISANETKNSETQKDKEQNETFNDNTSSKRRRRSSNESELRCTRILRSSTANIRLSTEDNIKPLNASGESNMKSLESPNVNEIKMQTSNVNKQLDRNDSNVINYDDLDVFSENIRPEKEMTCPVNQATTDPMSCHPKESILCSMIEKYGVETVRPFAKKIPDNTVKSICEKFEQEIANILELPFNETKNAMDKFIADLQKLNYKHFIAGLMKYLTKPERRTELFAKVVSPPAPAMTKAEQVLLYLISHLKTNWPTVDIVDTVLSNIEYTLFKLNRTPEFDVIDSTSHFYALLCRYFGAKSRLRLFILDAMYCIQYKSVSLIKQCLDVWMHIIPLAHMGIAKSPLVTCLVYLLHFYKCEDKLNKVQEIRNILSRKYFYQITNWNETTILEMFRNSIKELKDIPIEKKMLRLALIILAKRNGPRWCQNNIIKKLLQPMIEKENVPNNVKEFCVSMIGPLMKPYPVDMKVYCEIAMNQFTDILNNEPSPRMEEAVITSMMFINRHDQYRINQTLLTRKMKPMSPELEGIIRDYVRAKPLKIWKKHLSKMARY